jgi:hypothetical protein
MRETRLEDWIDPHVHILPPRRLRGLIRWVKSFTPDFPVPETITAQEVLAGIRGAGIKRFFNLVFPLWPEETDDLNLFNHRLCREVPEAVGFGSLHIENPDKGGITRRCLFEYGFAGMKLHPFAQRFPAFDPAMDPLFEALDRHGRPLLVHTGFDLFYGEGPQDAGLLRVLERYPGMPVLLVHALFPRFGFARELLERFPQVWLDLTNSVSCMRIYLEWKNAGEPLPPQAATLEAEDVESNLEDWYALFEERPGRLLYGTDFPAGFGDHASLYDDLLYFGLPGETVRMLLRDNVLAFLASSGIRLPEA